jgi:hypothetical protein
METTKDLAYVYAYQKIMELEEDELKEWLFQQDDKSISFVLNILAEVSGRTLH